MAGVDTGVMKSDLEKVMVMGRGSRISTNAVCRQCIRKCKQPGFMVLVQCPKFKSVRTDTPLSSRREKRSRIQNKRGKSGN